MAIFIPPGSNGKKSRKKIKKAPPIRPAKAVETDYFKSFVSNINSIIKAGAVVNRMVQAGDGLNQTINFWKSQQLLLFPEFMIDNLAQTVVGKANQIQKNRFESIISKALGVDVIHVIDSEKIADTVNIALQRNIDLIKTVKSSLFGDVQEAVFNNFSGVAQPENRTLLQQIQHIGKVSKSRARLIARDQSQKLNSSFNQIRQEEAGIEKYTWRNSQDRRVVGNPIGLYPKPSRVHGNHWKREGKIYRWDDGPRDGHPGQPIQCRCTAEPFIDLDNLNIM
jgi:uncharacterized protein with gpF-like domain